MSGLYSLARPFVMRLDPEKAHRLAITAYANGLYPRSREPDPAALKTTLWGLDFPNPVGMAAGFDKNGEVPDQIINSGFGFAEIGSVTPRPQLGNPQPRVFRLQKDRAVINRLGFNNEGHEALATRLVARADRGGIVGVNVGANKDSKDRHQDYALGIKRFAPYASYLTVNVSSPNTPGLRDLQARDELDKLLVVILDARQQTIDSGIPSRPVLLKIAPDIGADGLKDIAEIVLKRGIDGVIVSNTTLSRGNLNSTKANETGGLSGRPLFDLSTHILAKFYLATGGELPLVGVGGIEDGRTAYEKIRAGASLVQFYTAMVFEGPELVAEIKRDLLGHLAKDGHDLISNATGTGAADWAAKDFAEKPRDY
ncbi:MAG: quinone-dependent dihydroorotate dehydrogenase [Rhizobiales bacterium]|nr:quinone-dependent dihydroorotate dehydrogenase [Hyphomicrobiales bacterium]